MSHHCHDEHHDHGHGHEGHDHSDDITPAVQHSLYQHINFDDITTLNEARHGMGRDVVKKAWADRAGGVELESDADEQLLMTVPFTGQVKLHSISLLTSPSSSAPRTLKVFANLDLDFATAEEAEPTQTFDLSQTSEVQELPVKRAKFSSVQRLALFFEDNFSGGEEDVTRVTYLGFKGEWMALGRAPKEIIYEAAANPGDHELKGTSINRMGHGIGGRGGGGGGF